jgi:Post-segregation antitoxin CcdA
MTVTIELPPEVEAGLVAQAQALGVPLSQYLEHLLREQVPQLSSASLSPAERAAAWRESAKGLPHTPPLSDQAISRESIYSDRG